MAMYFKGKKVAPIVLTSKPDMLQSRVDETKSCAYLFYRYSGTNPDIAKDLNTANVTDMQYMFCDCSKLKTTINVSNLNTGNVNSMMMMFANDYIETLDLSNFDTINNTSLYGTFQNNNSLKTIIISPAFSTENVTNMSYIFMNCSSMSSIDLSNFNTVNVTNMTALFKGCGSLASLDLSSFNTSNVTNMEDMFNSCMKITSLDLSNFNTSNLTRTYGMFSYCTKLQYLDISNFDFTKVTSYTNMFNNVPADCEILVKDETAKEWITSKFTNLTNVKVKGAS